MAEPGRYACSICGAMVLDAVICTGCSRRLELALGDVPALVTDLETVLAKLTVYADEAQRVTGSRADEEIVPFNITAGQARQHLHAVLTSWVRIVWIERYHSGARDIGPACQRCQHDSCRTRRAWTLPVDRSSACAGWLLHDVEWMRHQGWASEAIDNILGVITDVRKCLDAPTNRATINVGPCPESECEGEVTAFIPRDPTAVGTIACSVDPLHNWNSTQLLRLSKKFARHQTPIPIKPHLKHYEAGPCLGCGGLHFGYRRDADAAVIEHIISTHLDTCAQLHALHLEVG